MELEEEDPAETEGGDPVELEEELKTVEQGDGDHAQVVDDVALVEEECMVVVACNCRPQTRKRSPQRRKMVHHACTKQEFQKQMPGHVFQELQAWTVSVLDSYVLTSEP